MGCFRRRSVFTAAPVVSRSPLTNNTTIPKYTLALVVFVLVAGCAKHPPHLTPEKRAFVEVPADGGGVVESEERMDITIPAFNPLTAADPQEQVKARFRGVDRKTPKTTVVRATLERFDDLAELIASLPDDDNMVDHEPEIGRDTMTRATEEKRNVRVNAWIYAIKYEADQDWHVILGSDPDLSGPKAFFNAEISGLPAPSAASRQTLLNVRTALADMLENQLPSGSNYRRYTEPIPVVVEGSLFFDIDHQAGVVGPEGMRPKTAWEIHPVTKLRLQ